MSTHPAPWTWERETNSTWILNDGNGEPIIQGDSIAAFVPDDDVRALIAAAPEMLDLLRTAAYETQPNGVCGDIHCTGTFREDMLALLACIDAASEPRQPR